MIRALVVFSGALVSASLAAAQTGQIILAPVAPPSSVPALNAPMMLLLAAMLGFAAWRTLRRGSRQTIAAAALLATSAVALVGYASVSLVVVSGEECNHQTVAEYTSYLPWDLLSECPNPIQIVSIEPCGGNADTLAPRIPETPDCEEGMILNNGDRCSLPTCNE